MKKIAYILASTIEVLLLIGAYVVNYYTRSRMGMARYVVYINQQWETSYPVKNVIFISKIFFALTAMLIVLLLMLRRKQLTKLEMGMCVMTCILTMVYEFFAFRYSTDVLRAYYFICLILAVTVGIQMVKTMVGVYKAVNNVTSV